MQQPQHSLDLSGTRMIDPGDCYRDDVNASFHFTLQLYSPLFAADRHIYCSFALANWGSVYEINRCITSAETPERNHGAAHREMGLHAGQQRAPFHVRCTKQSHHKATVSHNRGQQRCSSILNMDRPFAPSRVTRHKEIFSEMLPSYDAAPEEAEYYAVDKSGYR